MTDTSTPATDVTPQDPAVSLAPSVVRFRTQVPTPRDFAVPRPRLLTLVDDGLQYPLTVIAGPAGTGKTSLAESWVSAHRERVHIAWLTLDSEHNQAGVFWRYVLEALRGHGVDLAHVGSPLLPDNVERSFLEDVAAVLGDAPHPVVLVLDQLERITDERVLRQLDFVLHAAQPGVRVIATTRREPRALTHRRRLSGEMAVIQAADLAFTHEETAQLLERHGLDPPDDAVTALQETTEGWAAGLRLCALAMREHGDRAGPTGGPWAERRLAGYLVDEVLDAMPGNTREQLLRMCVVDRVEPGLAQALAERPDAERVLLELAGEDLFVTTGTVPERWYRIHPLLLGVLREELGARGTDAVTDQHARAARWYDAHGDVTRSAVHYVAAGSWRECCASVVRNLGVVELIENRAPRDLEEALAQVPQDLDAPQVRVVQVATDLGAHRLDRAAERLNGLEPPDASTPSGRAVRASVALSRLVLAGGICDTRAAVDAWEALEPTLNGLGPWRARVQARALALASLSSALLWSGADRAMFARILGAAAEAAEVEGCEFARISVRGQQALAAYRRGALGEAARLGEEALRLGREHGLPASHRTGAGHLAMSAVALEWNDRLGSQRHIEHADLTAQAQNDPMLGAAVKLMRAYHHALDGRRTLAMATIADVRASALSGALPSWIVERLVVADAMVRLRCGDVEGAVSVLDATPSPAGDWLFARATAAYADGDVARALSLLTPITSGDLPPEEGGDVYALLLVTRIRLDGGDLPAARRAVGDALRAARPEGRRRPFVESRGWLQHLLADDPELTRASSWIGTGLVPGARGPGDVAPALVEPLTSRETTVLRLMAQVMTVADIAADLHVSVNTVKTHQKGVYRKLSVARAHDAVRRGRDLELI